MTKKHFVAIAAIIRELIGGNLTLPERVVVRIVTRRLANYFATTNKHFDRGRFLAACGLED